MDDAAYWRDWRSKNRERSRAHVNDYSARHAAILAEAKAGKPCARCGEIPADSRRLHFHHVRGVKRFAVSHWRKSFPRAPGESKADAIRAEIAKCDLLCSTCHVREHSAV